MRKFISSLVVLFFSFNVINAQSFYTEVNTFSKIDSLQAPPKNAILLIGSSSFTYWKDVATYFPGQIFINRAFGGSSLTHQIEYVE